jgi:hypothetical protein
VCSSVAVSFLACARPWAPTTAFQNKNKNSWVLVTQNCIHSYSGGSNQEDHSSKPAWTNSWWGPISKKPDIKEDWWSGSNCRLEFKPQYCKKKKKRRKRIILYSCLPPTALKIQPHYIFSFPAPVLSGRPCRDAHQDPGHSNSILSKPMKSVQTYLSSHPKEIKTLPGVFTLHYRTCRDPAHTLATHLPTHRLTPFPPWPSNYLFIMPKYCPLYSQGSLSSEFSLLISSCYTLIFWPPYCNCVSVRVLYRNRTNRMYMQL